MSKNAKGALLGDGKQRTTKFGNRGTKFPEVKLAYSRILYKIDKEWKQILLKSK